MEIKDEIDALISHQEGWINDLKKSMDELRKYRDGVLPYNEDQIENIVHAQAEVSKAVKNLANSIRGKLDKNQ